MIRNVKSAEYQFAGAKMVAAGRAVCPFCSGWHRRSDGGPLTEQCDARFIRVRKVAIFVRGRPVSLGSGVRVPTAAEKSVALEHAFGVLNG